jgi:hypothetical protein
MKHTLIIAAALLIAGQALGMNLSTSRRAILFSSACRIAALISM